MWLMFTAVACLNVAGDTPKPELLPDVPDGWRFERLDFPLEFAPDLGFTGFEELQFGPGMFEVGSDTYWTYIFAMKITNTDVTLDAARLKSMLEAYYRGLCRAVAKDKKMAIDEAQITAQITPSDPARPGRYHATMQSYDAFVTGQPLALDMDIVIVRVGDHDLRLFATVSPAPRTADVWKSLAKMTDAFVAGLARSTP